MGIENRGFGSMSAARRREISALGGKAAQKKGTCHHWTKEEARIAGRKGGRRSVAVRKARITQEPAA